MDPMSPLNDGALSLDALFDYINDDSDYDLSISDDDDDNDVVYGVIDMMAAFVQLKADTRKFKWQEDRLVWDDYVAKLEHKNEFHGHFRMSKKAFTKLCELLRVYIAVDEVKARNSVDTEPIYPELVVAVSIRWLAGGIWDDIKDAFGISRSSFYRVTGTFINACLVIEDLAIVPPTTPAEIQRQASLFASKTSADIFRGCVGAIDGILIPIKCPTVMETNNSNTFFSGHYKRLGLNCQAVSDHRGKFLFFAVAAPGGCPDSSSYNGLTDLPTYVEDLPPGYYLVGDNAYVLTEHLLIPFSGSQREAPVNSAFNYYLSQLRIRIEQAFGLFTSKWRIFRRPIETSLAKASKMIRVCARLHNFIIDEDWEGDDLVDETDLNNTEVHIGAGLGEAYLPIISELTSNKGSSCLREEMVAYIDRKGLRRPMHNLERNRCEEYEDLNLE